MPLRITNRVSQNTIDRIRQAAITDVPSDEDLLAQSDIILSIVPPRDALATAKRIADACKTAADARIAKKRSSPNSVVFIDLNAISPRTVAKINAFFNSTAVPTSPRPTESLTRRLTRSLSFANDPERSDAEPDTPPIKINMLDGAIIGSPPSKQKAKADTGDDDTDGSTSTWNRPSIPLSGPHKELLTQDLLDILNAKFISEKLGTASALKSCFASLTKGFTALSILSYTTAATCGVLPELQSHLNEFMPGLAQRAEKGLIGMPPKAYRWVDEMREIGKTFKSSGGLKFGAEMFDQVAEVYRFVAEDTALGEEKVGKRKRGTTVEDVTALMEEGVHKKMQKRHGKDEKLEMAWRGSWGL